MEGLIVFLFLAASAFVYANLRDALNYSRVLVEKGAFRPDTVARWRDALLTRALVIAAVLMVIALRVVPPAADSRLTGADALFLWVLTSGVIFSQLFEQWTLRACKRLAPVRGGARQR